MIFRAILKWSLIAIGCALGFLAIFVVLVYVSIGNHLSRTFEHAGSFIESGSVANVAEGERLARIRGCAGGCHGDSVNGMVFFELPDGSRIVAPDLARAVRNYSERELENLIRHGIRPDGTSLIRIMPSSMFYHLSDEDLGAILAYLRSQQPRSDPLPNGRLGPLARLLLAFVRKRLGTILAAEEVDHGAPKITPEDEISEGSGRYLAVTICSECHGENLRGSFVGPVQTPTLAVVAGYSLDDFTALMRTGQPIGLRAPGLMRSVAQQRLSYLTDREIGQLHEYLKTLSVTAVDP